MADVVTGAGLVLLAGLALSSHLKAADDAIEAAQPYDTWADGATTALSMPWNWLVPIALVAALMTRARAT